MADITESSKLTGYGTINYRGSREYDNESGIHHHNRNSGLLERWFKLSERGTTVGKEIRAGTTSFLTISYILLVNPFILGQPNTGT
mmetsp:Transcript_15362/g.18149  ORF Transcript_15362/g.18149 Transcript_15362/m.18149 type:complete len:86 (+) Transcript_15362:263-520(+)